MNIQVGLACTNEIICKLLGWGLAIAALVLVGFVIKGIWDEYWKT